jgi:hypothetical protein
VFVPLPTVRLEPIRDVANAIHYLETSGTSVLRLEHLCALESAALHNNDSDVVLSLRSATLALTPAVELLTANYRNVKFAFLDIEERLHDTAAGLGVESPGRVLEAIQRSSYEVRMLYLYARCLTPNSL